MYVLPLVAALGDGPSPRPGPDGLAEQPDLVAGVVEVVLPGDGVAAVLQDPGQGIAVGRVAASDNRFHAPLDQ